MSTPYELIAAARKAVADGEAIVARTAADHNIAAHGEAPLMQAWLRGERPRRPDPLDLAADEIVRHIVASMTQGRQIAAALALVKLRCWFASFNPADLPVGENTWQQFASKRIPLPATQVTTLLGRCAQLGGILHCTDCGAATPCPCGCGSAYKPEFPWVEPGADDDTKSDTKIRRGRPPLGEAPMTNAERSRKRRERQRNAPPASATREERDSERVALTLLADRIRELGERPYTGTVDDDVIAVVEGAALRWTEMANNLKQRRRKANGKTKKD